MGIVYDKELAVAELEQFSILIAHHLRRIEVANDTATARHFHQTIGTLEHKTRMTVKRLLQSKTK